MKGKKRTYTMSDNARAQRVNARIKTGEHSLFLKELSRYGEPVPKDANGKPVLSVKHLRILGNKWQNTVSDKEFFELFKAHLAGLRHKEAYLMKEIAYLRTKVDIQEIKDGQEGIVISPEYIKSIELFTKLMEYQDKLKDKAPTQIPGIFNMNIDFSAKSEKKE